MARTAAEERINKQRVYVNCIAPRDFCRRRVYFDSAASKHSRGRGPAERDINPLLIRIVKAR